jgi:hypothetical protein
LILEGPGDWRCYCLKSSIDKNPSESLDFDSCLLAPLRYLTFTNASNPNAFLENVR